MSHATEPAPAHAPHGAPVPLRMGVPIPNGKLGMWLFLGTEIMFFTAFIGTYIVLRLGSPGWPTDPAVTHINVLAGAFNTFVLICSSVSVVLAHAAMVNRNYPHVVRMMVVTFVLACVFLGVKSIEYYGKFSHDILPGHVAESPQAALDKMIREMDARTGIADFKKQKTVLTNELATNPSKERAAEIAERVKEVDASIAEKGNLDKAYTLLRDKVKSQAIDVHAAEGELKKLQADFPGTFDSVHEPHFIPYGNTFASAYFTMTGFHALHVVLGMGMFAGVIWLGKQNKLGPQHEVMVENFGLYWHFVDLVWIFLFPLLYII